MSLDAHDVAIASRPSGSVGTALQHPNEMHQNTAMQENVMRVLEGDDPENTRKQFGPKMAEYFEFCKAVYPGDEHSSILAREKMYRFLYYQSFREKKKRGGHSSSRANQPAFDVQAYREVMGSRLELATGVALHDIPTPQRPISISVFDVYKATLRRIYLVQKMRTI